MTIDTVLFDLDGTLLDTAPDLGGALNAVLVEQGYQPLPLSHIRPFVSLGSRTLIRRGFNLQEGDTTVEPLLKRLLAIYAEHLVDQTRLFPGMETVLKTLEARHIQWGVVTNKPDFLTQPLLKKLGLAQRMACIISGDTLPEKKPHPAPLLHACQLAGSQPERCIYVGDARRDIEAGQRANMRTVAVAYGYIEPTDDPYTWGATTVIERPSELVLWLDETTNCQPVVP